jgi:glycosyltransferase involved in cell wall biosynthesis
MQTGTICVDLHVHSKFSKRPSQWILQKIGCPESFTEPLDIYRIAKMRGMNLVTITDHNRIEGALAIAHLPDTFISEEITTYFPENRCKIHVLALNITEKQHADIQKVRQNIYALVDYLVDANIVHIVAHPLFSINERLTIEHFEKLLLLFKNFEMNGARNDGTNECLQRILQHLTPKIIARLSDKHGIEPRMPTPWRKNITGGSDDHSSLNIARTYTEIPAAESRIEALNGILNNRARVIRHPSTPLTFAHVLYGIAYQFYHNKFGLEKYTTKDVLLNFLDHSLRPNLPHEGPGFIAKIYHFLHYRKRPRVSSQVPESLEALVRHETGKILHDNPHLLKPNASKDQVGEDPEKNWFDFVDQVANRITLNFAGHLMDHLSGANVFNIFHTVGSAGGLYAMLAPYFLAYSYFSQDREFYSQIYRHFKLNAHADRTAVRGDRVVAQFVDHFFDPGSVEAVLTRLRPCLVHADKKFEILTCGPNHQTAPVGVNIFEPIGTYEHADFPGRCLYFPPLLQMLKSCYEKNVTRIQSVTPGPVGLAALAIARILKRPVYGTYHPSLLRYAPFLGGDESIDDILERFMGWYYAQLDRIYVFSPSDEAALLRKGIDPLKIMRVAPEIDLQRFHPARRNGYLQERYGIRSRSKIVFAGQVSSENHLQLLTEVFKILLRTVAGVHLILAGDSIPLDNIKRSLNGLPCTFLNCKTDRELGAVFASSDLAVFSDLSGQNGQRLLQAQASGLPVIVAAKNMPSAHLVPESTGVIVKGSDVTELFEAIVGLIGNPTAIRSMGRQARRHVEDLFTDALVFRASQPVEAGCTGDKPSFSRAG